MKLSKLFITDIIPGEVSPNTLEDFDKSLHGIYILTGEKL
jgi:hypothetical protein